MTANNIHFNTISFVLHLLLANLQFSHLSRRASPNHLDNQKYFIHFIILIDFFFLHFQCDGTHFHFDHMSTLSSLSIRPQDALFAMIANDSLSEIENAFRSNVSDKHSKNHSQGETLSAAERFVLSIWPLSVASINHLTYIWFTMKKRKLVQHRVELQHNHLFTRTSIAYALARSALSLSFMKSPLHHSPNRSPSWLQM